MSCSRICLKDFFFFFIMIYNYLVSAKRPKSSGLIRRLNPEFLVPKNDE